MARAGHDVTLVDPWSAHIDTIKRNGLHLGGTQGEHDVQVRALHISDVQSLPQHAVDIAFICMKLYDTDWAVALIKPYLAPDGFVVSMQNSRSKNALPTSSDGAGHAPGCIASTISVEAVAPGRIMRTQLPGGDAYTVFRVGELHGAITARAERVAQMLRAVDSAKVTGELVGRALFQAHANTMTYGRQRRFGSGSQRSGAV